MKKNAKIITVLSVGVVVAAIAYYFLIYKPGKAAKVAAASGGAQPPASTTTSGGGSTAAPAPVIDPLIGKHLYAKQAGVRVVNANGTTAKTAAKDEWVGLAYARVTLGGLPFYKVSGNEYVSANLVYAK